MPNSITWASLHKSEAKKERKEKIKSMFRFAVIIFMWFSVGFFAGRFFEAVARGSIF